MLQSLCMTGNTTPFNMSFSCPKLSTPPPLVLSSTMPHPELHCLCRDVKRQKTGVVPGAGGGRGAVNKAFWNTSFPVQKFGPFLATRSRAAVKVKPPSDKPSLLSGSGLSSAAVVGLLAALALTSMQVCCYVISLNSWRSRGAFIVPGQRAA